MRPGFTRRRGLWLAFIVIDVLVVAGVLVAVLVTRGGGGAAGTTAGSGTTARSTAVSAEISSAISSAEQGTVVVPAVVGQSQVHAVALIKTLGLEALARTSASGRPKGTVLVQNPAAGTRLGHGALVGLVVSAGPRAGSVPDVVGLPAAVALGRLREAGYTVASRAVVSRRRAGLVSAQSPAGGAKVDRGQVVISVSMGPPRVAVPNVAGLSLTAAKAALRKAGLPVAIKTVASQKPPGTVLAQSPAGGAQVPQGTTVRLRVVGGSAGGAGGTVTVPNVFGRQMADAQAIVRAAGLVPKVVRSHSLKPVGEVVDQNPAAGRQAERGATMTISVSSGPGP